MVCVARRDSTFIAVMPYQYAIWNPPCLWLQLLAQAILFSLSYAAFRKQYLVTSLSLLHNCSRRWLYHFCFGRTFAFRDEIKKGNRKKKKKKQFTISHRGFKVRTVKEMHVLEQCYSQFSAIEAGGRTRSHKFCHLAQSFPTYSLTSSWLSKA